MLVPTTPTTRDRFDDIADDTSRVGAHRAYNPRIRWGVILAWSLVATLLIVAAGVIAMMFATGRFDPAPTATSEATSAAPVAPEIDTSIPIVVLNASGDEAQSETVSGELVAAGWSSGDITTAPANEDDFPETTVYYASAEDEAAARGVAETVLGGARVELSEAYQPQDDSGTDEDESALRQLVVVIGIDRL